MQPCAPHARRPGRLQGVNNCSPVTHMHLRVMPEGNAERAQGRGGGGGGGGGKVGAGHIRGKVKGEGGGNGREGAAEAYRGQPEGLSVWADEGIRSLRVDPQGGSRRGGVALQSKPPSPFAMQPTSPFAMSATPPPCGVRRGEQQHERSCSTSAYDCSQVLPTPRALTLKPEPETLNSNPCVQSSKPASFVREPLSLLVRP
jgi:hypothetical protein